MDNRQLIRVLWAEDNDDQFSQLSAELERSLANQNINVEFVRAVNGDQVYRPCSPRSVQSMCL